MKKSSKGLIKLVAVLATAFGILFGFSVSAELSPREQLIEKRIKPVGDVYLSGQVPTTAAGGGDTLSPEERYNSVCATCHKTGVAGAPIVGDKKSWASHVKKGMKTLNEHAIKGFKGMPPKGTCMQCSDDEIIAIVKWMVSKSK